MFDQCTHCTSFLKPSSKPLWKKTEFAENLVKLPSITSDKQWTWKHVFVALYVANSERKKKLYKEYTENANDNDNEHNFYPRQIYI